MDLLNPSLYKRLRAAYGEVRVSGQGEAMDADSIRDDDGAPHLQIRHPGEYYKVSCPYCDDTRFRLWVNHRYGQYDDTGRRLTFLAVCYNEGCLTDTANRDDFWETLSSLGEIPLEKCRVGEGRDVAAEARVAHPPGPCKRLDELPPGHKARAYLEGRGFDPDWLARFYGVSYCWESHYFLARQRLIVPVYQYGKYRGWQARYVGELPWKDPEKKKGLPPKYFSCPGMSKHLMIYNWDAARNWATGVVVEGVTDVWSFGPMAGCTFGDSLSDHQIRMVTSRFRGRSLVLLYDPEALGLDAVNRRIERLETMLPGQLAVVKLPEGRDPGNLDRAYLREYVRRRAAEAGVKVCYEKAKS